MKRDDTFLSHVGQGNGQTVDRAVIPWIECRPVDGENLVLAVVKQDIEDFLTIKSRKKVR